MKLGFVVVTYNRPDAVLAVLRALAPQCPTNASVVIADDGSRPENVAAMKAGLPSFDCPVRHVWHPDVGFTASRARNLGALHTRADYVIFMDGDCVPNPRFVEHHLRLAQEKHFVNGSRLLLGERLSRQVTEGVVHPQQLRRRDWLRLRLSGDVNKLTHLLYWAGAPGRVQTSFRWSGIRSCNFGVWYRDLAAVNGFDETFEGWGHEDADLVLRLHNHGLRRKNGYLGTEVYHLWHPEASRAGEERNRNLVMQRMQGRLVRAEAGLAEAAADTAAVVTELN